MIHTIILDWGCPTGSLKEKGKSLPLVEGFSSGFTFSPKTASSFPGHTVGSAFFSHFLWHIYWGQYCFQLELLQICIQIYNHIMTTARIDLSPPGKWIICVERWFTSTTYWLIDKRNTFKWQNIMIEYLTSKNKSAGTFCIISSLPLDEILQGHYHYIVLSLHRSFFKGKL